MSNDGKVACPEILLSPDECTRARAAAKARLAHATAVNRNAHGRVGRDLEEEVRGVESEIAVAQFLGLEWSGASGTYRTRADVGEQAEVKTIAEVGRRLLLRGADVHEHGDRAYFLVLWMGRGRLALLGWTWGNEAEKIGRWSTPTPGRPPCVLIEPYRLRRAETAKGVIR